ncbi:MAG: putative hydrogenase 4, component [Planctomycetaceae bacterium]|nr:putative hydrogenase 4, component [Planctomycetaceae bacterium]
MFYCLLVFHLAIVLIAPIFSMGLINRVKSLWAGRRGPRLNQTWFDLVRLLHKTPVYSVTTSWIFPIAPLVILATTITASLLSPIVPGFAPLGFRGDFVAFAYILGLGKLFLMLGALDTGSAFEGMGASREATYSALAEPALLLGLGTLAWASGSQSFQDLVMPDGSWFNDIALRILIGVALMVVLLIESSRVPADDPCTHLELTMVHEVMILDHSGPELAIVQYASAMKMTMFAGIVASILNPFSANSGPLSIVLAVICSVVLISAIAIFVGLIESVTARLRFRALPLFTMSAFIAVLLALVVTAGNQGVSP